MIHPADTMSKITRSMMITTAATQVAIGQATIVLKSAFLGSNEDRDL